MMKKCYILFFCIACLSATHDLFFSTAFAQSFLTDTTKAKADAEWPKDSLGRRTPRGTVVGFINAVAEEDYQRAAQYLDLHGLEDPSMQGPELAHTLQNLVDLHGKLVSRSLISNDYQGRRNDDLPPNMDKVGDIDTDNETFDIYVEQTQEATKAPLWLISAETLQTLPTMTAADDGLSVNRVLPSFLLNNKWSGVPIGHWLAMLLFVALAYLVALAVVALVMGALRTFWSRARNEGAAAVLQAFVLPLRLFLAVQIFVFLSQHTGISIVARQSFSEIIFVIGLVAFLMLVWQLVEVFTELGKRWLVRQNNPGGISAVLFFGRAVKVLMVVFGAIMVLGSVGVDVTAGLAALGIGGIALALGAQKTVENLVGSITLITDQPLRVGDFCKVDDTSGTIERIGMRSTRIRTLDRTVVFIPNGQLAALKIENYAYRDRFWFHPTLTLRFETTPDQMRYLLVELRAILYAHPRVDPDPARVRFTGIGSDSKNIEIFSYVHARDISEFLEVQEDLLLRIMDVVATSGTDFAFPSQTVYMARDAGVAGEKTQQAEQQVQHWREQGDLQIPAFDAAKISKLKDTIDYPPKGSSAYQGKGQQHSS